MIKFRRLQKALMSVNCSQYLNGLSFKWGIALSEGKWYCWKPDPQVPILPELLLYDMEVKPVTKVSITTSPDTVSILYKDLNPNLKLPSSHEKFFVDWTKRIVKKVLS